MLKPQKTQRQGAMMVLVAITLPLIVIMTAFALDVAWMQLVSTELRTATDAASRAGAKALSIHQTEGAARTEAIAAARRNIVAGVPHVLLDSEIEIGQGEQANRNSRFSFHTGTSLKNSVKVRGNRTAASADGPVNLFLGRIFGVASFEPTQFAISTLLDRDICLVLDRSGSMRGSKIQDLKAAVEIFLTELESTIPEEQVALVSYSTTDRLDERLTKDYTQIQQTANGFQASGLTAIGMALDEGIKAMNDPRRRPFAVPTIVLMTDGRHNRGFEPIIPARQAAQQGITVHTVTFGRGADFRRMRDVANATGGQHFHADNGLDLKEVFRDIAATLPVLTTE